MTIYNNIPNNITENKCPNCKGADVTKNWYLQLTKDHVKCLLVFHSICHYMIILINGISYSWKKYQESMHYNNPLENKICPVYLLLDYR